MRVTIVGGGIGGLTAAIALRRRGIEAEVYEKSAALRDVGAGIALWPNAVKALRKLGLEELLDSISVKNVDGAVRRWTGTYLSRTSARELERRFGGGMIVLHRAELLEVLAGSVGFANIHLGHVFVGGNAFANGATADGDVLVGADGLRSAVRTWLGHVDQARYSGYTAWRAVVPFEHSAFVPAETWGHGKRFGMFPVQGNRVYWFATSNAHEGEYNPNESQQALLLSMFKGWHEPVEALIRSADDSTILRNDIYDRDPLPSWGRGRVTLLGDAAHPMTPNFGQGACQAIEDAVELASCLAAEPNVEAGLRNYETRRIARTSSIVLTSRRLGMFAQIETPALCWLRDLALWLTPGSVTFRSLAPVIGYEGHLGD